MIVENLIRNGCAIFVHVREVERDKIKLTIILVEIGLLDVFQVRNIEVWNQTLLETALIT